MTNDFETSSDRIKPEQMLARAKLFAELARRTQSPFDALPGSDASAALVVLWEEAAFWALSALGAPSTPPRDLVTALESAPREVVVQAAGGAEWLPVVEQALAVDPRNFETLPVPARDRRQIQTLAQFVRSLISHLETPVRERRKRQWGGAAKWMTIVVAAFSVIIGVALSWHNFLPNRVRGAKRTLSSELRPCRTTEDCGNALFHTEEEDQPWVKYDFGRPIDLHSIDVENRTDCCYDRAVPLIVETSLDGESWSEQARADRAFGSWSSPLRGRAQFLRLRTDHKTYLHLGAIVVR
jgi:hypothetical protein